MKTFILSLAIHLAHVLPCPKTIGEKLLSAITSFVWVSHMERPSKQLSNLPTATPGGFRNPRPFFVLSFNFHHYSFQISHRPGGTRKIDASLLDGFPTSQHSPCVFPKHSDCHYRIPILQSGYCSSYKDTSQRRSLYYDICHSKPGHL